MVSIFQPFKQHERKYCKVSMPAHTMLCSGRCEEMNVEKCVIGTTDPLIVSTVAGYSLSSTHAHELTSANNGSHHFRRT